MCFLGSEGEDIMHNGSRYMGAACTLSRYLPEVSPFGEKEGEPYQYRFCFSQSFLPQVIACMLFPKHCLKPGSVAGSPAHQFSGIRYPTIGHPGFCYMTVSRLLCLTGWLLQTRSSLIARTPGHFEQIGNGTSLFLPVAVLTTALPK